MDITNSTAALIDFYLKVMLIEKQTWQLISNRINHVT